MLSLFVEKNKEAVSLALSTLFVHVSIVVLFFLCQEWGVLHLSLKNGQLSRTERKLSGAASASI